MERLRFDHYVERRLYSDTEGFYEVGGAAGGRRGDFVTSVETGPLFGRLMARWLDARWLELDRPDPFVVVEAGAGRGTLARTVRAARPACAAALSYLAVERSAALRAAIDVDGVEVRADLPGAGAAHAVIANELLDNLAFRMVEKQGAAWRDVWVELDGGTAALVVGEEAAGCPLPVDLDDGVRLPWCEQAALWVERARTVAAAGRVLVLDYGVEDSRALAGRQWCRTYGGHARGFDPLATGPLDITTDVGFDQLPPGALIRTQAEFLAECGIDQLVEEGRRIWADRAAVGDLEALAARSRVREADALTDPEGLGAFLVGEWAGSSRSADEVGHRRRHAE